MVTSATVGGRMLPDGRPALLAEELRLRSARYVERIPGSFQLLLALYIILTGDFPTVVQALAFGLPGGGASGFATAAVTAIGRDLLLLAPVVALSNHRLGILHPLLLAVVVWPVVLRVPGVIEEFGGWAGVLAGVPVETPFFLGLPWADASTVWTAIAKYNGLQIIALVSTYLGFWLFSNKHRLVPRPIIFANTAALRTVLIVLIGLSTIVFFVFIDFRGGVGEHLTSLGRGRFRELAGAGPIVVATQLGAIAMYLWVAARPNDIKSPLFLFCLAAVTTTQFISGGSRSSALAVPMLVGIIWALRRQRVPWKITLFLVPLMFASLGLMGSIRTSSWRGSTAGEALSTTGWAESFQFMQKEIVARSAKSANIPIIERGFQVSDGPLLGRSYLAAVTAFVPRALWEEKPRSTDSLYMQLFFGAPRVGTGIPVNSVVEVHWNFGLPGVVLISIIYGVLIRLVYHFYWRRYRNPFAVVFYALFITQFDFGTGHLVDFQQTMALLLVAWVIVAMFVPKSAGIAEQRHRGSSRERYFAPSPKGGAR